MPILLTGANGFVGKHLSRKMPVLPLATESGETIDLRDAASLRNFLRGVSIDGVVHLAGISDVPASLGNPRETYQVNFFGTLNLLEALRDSGFKGRFLYVGSAEEYGEVAEGDFPIREETPLKPVNPYAVSKVAAEALCHQFKRVGQFEIVLARPFNHIGPGQSERFVVSSLAKQLIEIKKKQRPPSLQIGDLSACRDFTDVRDVVDAYTGLLEKGENGEVYNVCSGVESRIQDLLEKMVSLTGVRPSIEVDPARLRSVDQKRFVGSSEKIKRKLGWVPKIPLEQTLKDVLADWEEKIT